MCYPRLEATCRVLAVNCLASLILALCHESILCVRHLRIATCPLLDMWAACLGSLLPKDGRLVDSYAGWRITGPSVICATNSLTCRIAAVYPELDSTSMIALEVF